MIKVTFSKFFEPVRSIKSKVRSKGKKGKGTV